MLQRLQKILANAGIASRRKCEELISAGRVRLNGSIATLGQSADLEKDIVEFDGKRISFEKKVYIMLNKPRGYITTTADPFAQKKVTDLVKVRERVFPVGRLDQDAEGLIILTNDGDFANMVMHPRYNVEKVYVVRLEKPLGMVDKKSIEEGVLIDGIKTWPARVKILSPDRLNVEIAIHEGRHKIVKRMFKSVGNYVLNLKRTRIGNLSLGGLKTGQYRDLEGEEINGFNG